MARIRTIKPEFPQSESIGRLSRDARLLFILLWTVVDDEGRARASSRMLASLLFPFDEDSPKLITGWLSELEREGHIKLYEAENSHYLYIPNWFKHQKIEKPSKSRLPSPYDCNQKVITEASPNIHRSLTEASATDLGPRTKEEKSAFSAIFSSVGTESEQSATALALEGARVGSASPPVEQSEESKRLAEQAEDAKHGWQPGLPTSEQLRAKYEAMEGNGGKAEENNRNQRVGRNLGENGGRQAAASRMVSASDGPWPSDERVGRDQACERGMESLGGVLRSIGLAPDGHATINGERHDAGALAGLDGNKIAPVSKPNGNFYAALGSPEQRAWEEHLGSSKRDKDGGLEYPAQWPPGAQP